MPLPSPKAWWHRWQRSGGTFLILSLLLHGALLIGAASWVVQTVQAKRKLTFAPAPPAQNSGSRQVEHRVQMAKRAQSLNAPPPPSRITTSAPSAPISLPDLPAFAPSAAPPRMPGAGIGANAVAFSAQTLQKIPTTLPMSGGPVTAFGFRGTTTPGLTGTFYDLKQTAKKEPLSNPSEAVDDLRRFAKTWSPAILSKYYRAKQELRAQRIYFPELSAVEAPKAFGVADEVKPSLWVVHYQGKVAAPKSGTFRFRGSAADWMIVRFDGKPAYDGGLDGSVFELDPETHQSKSRWISLSAGKTYDMEVLIGTYPGSVVYASLFMEEKDRPYEKDTRGEPILPLFQIGKTDPPQIAADAKHAPPFAKEPVIFQPAR
ncbi:MAG: hypothetical protein RLZZ399_2301 [Verrucomicrobiota bacterium]|jgi:hypothetical protein